MRCPHCNNVLKIDIEIRKGDKLDIALEQANEWNIKFIKEYVMPKQEGSSK